MRLLIAAALLAAAPASAETWRWQDDEGVEHWTDDPSLVPEARRDSIRRPGDDEDGWYSEIVVDEREESQAERRALQMRLQQRQQLLRDVERLQAAIDPLERQRLQANNEYRRYKVGGRIGATDRAAAALVRVEALDRQLATLRTELARAEARIALLD